MTANTPTTNDTIENTNGRIAAYKHIARTPAIHEHDNITIGDTIKINGDEYTIARHSAKLKPHIEEYTIIVDDFIVIKLRVGTGSSGETTDTYQLAFELHEYHLTDDNELEHVADPALNTLTINGETYEIYADPDRDREQDTLERLGDENTH